MRRTRGERLASAPKTALVALLFLAAHFGGLAHLAAMPHEVCERHGAVEHSPTASPPAVAEDPAHATSGPIAAAELPSDGEGAAHHEACLLSFLTRASACVRPSGNPLSVLFPFETRARLVQGARAPAAVPVYRLAPKHSPPPRG